MERLDACYFCGAAADAPLREVSVTHRAREGDPDAGVAVTLCADCEDKLQSVLGRVFEHVESRRVGSGDGPASDADASAAGEAGAGAASDGPAGTDEPTRGPDRSRVDRIDVSTAGAGDEPEQLFDPVGDLREVASAGDDADASAGAGTGRSTDGEDAEVLEDDEPAVRARATRTDPLDGVSVDEYNRVMRLLQNREFPMDRRAFVDLASSAYDLGEDTVEQVLDAVIDQGALDDRDGDLVRPGEGGGPAP